MHTAHDARRKGVAYAQRRTQRRAQQRDGLVDGPFCWRSGGGSVREKPWASVFHPHHNPVYSSTNKALIRINQYHHPVAAGGVGAELELGRESSTCTPTQRVLETRGTTHALGTSVPLGHRRYSLTQSQVRSTRFPLTLHFSAQQVLRELFTAY